jgi:hypothetical protein
MLLANFAWLNALFDPLDLDALLAEDTFLLIFAAIADDLPAEAILGLKFLPMPALRPPMLPALEEFTLLEPEPPARPEDKLFEASFVEPDAVEEPLSPAEDTEEDAEASAELEEAAMETSLPSGIFTEANAESDDPWSK